MMVGMVNTKLMIPTTPVASRLIESPLRPILIPLGQHAMRSRLNPNEHTDRNMMGA